MNKYIVSITTKTADLIKTVDTYGGYILESDTIKQAMHAAAEWEKHLLQLDHENTNIETIGNAVFYTAAGNEYCNIVEVNTLKEG